MIAVYLCRIFHLPAIPFLYRFVVARFNVHLQSTHGYFRIAATYLRVKIGKSLAKSQTIDKNRQKTKQIATRESFAKQANV